MSPDGKRIAFHSNRDGTGDIYVIGADGGGLVRLTNNPDRESQPGWTGDGMRVVYSVFAADTSRVFTVAPSVSDARQIAVVPARSVAISPDGRRVLYSAGTFPVLRLTVADLDGTNLESLSPDGRRIAVQAGKYSRTQGESSAHIWVIDVETGEAKKLVAHDQKYLDETPSWFPDGKRLAFQSARTGRMEVCVMNADGTGARQITR